MRHGGLQAACGRHSLPYTAAVVWAAIAAVPCFGHECQAAKAKSPLVVEGTSLVPLLPELDLDVVSLLHLRAVPHRRSHHGTATSKAKTDATKINASSGTVLISGNVSKTADEPRAAAAAPWLSPLTGSTHDVSGMPRTVLLAMNNQVRVLSNSGVHGSVVAIMILLITCIFCGVVGIILCTELRARPPKSQPESLPLQSLPSTQSAANISNVVGPSTRAKPTHELCPGGGFIVPLGGTRTIRVPALPCVPDPLYNFTIAAKDGETLCLGRYESAKFDPFVARPSIEYDCYISMTSEDNRELSTIVIGKPPSSHNIEGHIKYGSDYSSSSGFGIVRKTDDKHHPFEVVGMSTLKISVNGGQANRMMRIFTADFQERACATAYVTGQGQAWYEVTCYGSCDMLLTSLAIMGVDRISATDLLSCSTRLWR